jgi:hypothetical protein
MVKPLFPGTSYRMMLLSPGVESDSLELLLDFLEQVLG